MDSPVAGLIDSAACGAVWGWFDISGTYFLYSDLSDQYSPNLIRPISPESAWFPANMAGLT
jgi:hypothetical protein